MSGKKFELEHLQKPKAKTTSAKKPSKEPKVTPWAKDLFQKIEKLQEMLEAEGKTLA